MANEKFNPFTQGIFDIIKAFHDPVDKVFFSQFIPNVLHRIQFRTVGGLEDDTDV